MLTVILYILAIAVIIGTYETYYRFTRKLDKEMQSFQNQTELRK